MLSLISSITKGQGIPQSELYHSNGLIIQAEWTQCESVENGTSKEYVVLILENQNDHAVKLSFKKDMWYDGTCLSCDSESPEYVFSNEIEAHSTSKGGCEINNGLRIFSKMLDLKNVRHLTHFELNKISVREVN